MAFNRAAAFSMHAPCFSASNSTSTTARPEVSGGLTRICHRLQLLRLRGGSAVVAREPGAISGSNWHTQMDFQERLIAGSGARGVTQLLLHPIDVARTRLQAKDVKMVFTPRTFIKGITPQLVFGFPGGALQFICYEWAKDRFAQAQIGGAAPELISSAIGAIGMSVIAVPQELIKQRLQADVYKGFFSGARSLLHTEGPKGLYKGFAATLSRNVPWNALCFMFKGQAKRDFINCFGRKPNTEEDLALGALSGMTAAVIMTPIDVIKTRLMTGGGTGSIAGTFAKILREEGAGTLMKGVVPRVIYLAPAAALTLTIYDSIASSLVSQRLNISVKDLQ